MWWSLENAVYDYVKHMHGLNFRRSLESGLTLSAANTSQYEPTQPGPHVGGAQSSFIMATPSSAL